MSSAIIIFARLPIPGKAKTRLAASIGPQLAASLYASLAEHIFKETISCTGVKLYLACSDSNEQQDFGDWLSKLGILQHFTLISQIQSPDLGQRMSTAIQFAFEDGCSKVAIVGSDIPSLASQHLTSALSLLDRHQVVIGPAKDGGYYLLGLTQHRSELFQGIEWSTPHVRHETQQRCKELGLSVAAEEALPTLQDIDVIEDLLAWVDHAKISCPGQAHAALEADPMFALLSGVAVAHRNKTLS